MRSRRAKTAAALAALALLPVAALAVAPIHAAAASEASLLSVSGPLHPGASDYDPPTMDALLRGWKSDLFGSFAWDGFTVLGSFVQFSLNPSTGELHSFSALRGNASLPIFTSIHVSPSTAFSSTSVYGPTLSAANENLTLAAHDEPSGLLEVRTAAAPRNITFRFMDSANPVTAVSTSSAWPQAILSFQVGDTRGRMVLGSGAFNVTNGTVTALLDSDDLLALRIVPGFEDEPIARAAVLEAFASGRLAAEYALVSKWDGGWVESSAHYWRDLISNATEVTQGQVSVQFTSPMDRDGLAVLAFDPSTMPADESHRLVVTVNGAEIPEVTDMGGTLYAALGPEVAAYYVRLPMNATALAIYLPTFRWSTIQVASEASPAPTDPLGLEIAAAAALGLVAVAAAVMFRRQEE